MGKASASNLISVKNCSYNNFSKMLRPKKINFLHKSEKNFTDYRIL